MRDFEKHAFHGAGTRGCEKLAYQGAAPHQRLLPGCFINCRFWLLQSRNPHQIDVLLY
ncbi:MAG: hypothetical protein J5589_03640 [Firmicutes bacterium]|nr:hypothetical protein [Bacillota bacterium]